MELSFCDLRAKEVVNVCDGRRLGNIIDMIIDCNCARIVGIVVPYDRNFFHFFKSNQDIFIPWNRICKIGKDVILVELTPTAMPIACSVPNQPYTGIPNTNIYTAQVSESESPPKNQFDNKK